MSIKAICEQARHSTGIMVERFRAGPMGFSAGPGGGGGLSDLAAGGVVQGYNNSYYNVPNQVRVEEQMAKFRGYNYAAIRPIAQTMSALPFKVAKLAIKKASKGTPGRAKGFGRTISERVPLFIKGFADDLEVYEQHPLLDVFDDPNPLMTRWHLIYMAVAGLELAGRAHWWLTVDQDKPVIWPIPAPWIQPKHEPGKPFASWIIHPGGDQEKVEVPVDEIVYFYYPDPSNPLGFVSPTQANARSVVAAEAVQDARCAAFRNGHWPGLVVVAGDITDDEGGNQGKPLLEVHQRNQIIAAINRTLQGVDKTGAPIILDRLIQDVYKLTNTPREMDFLTSSKLARDEVFQGLGVSQYITGTSEPGSRAASAMAARHFADFVINPKADMISQVLTKCVAPKMAKPNERLYVYLEPYRPRDEENQRANMQLIASKGACTGNELRQLEDLPPRDDCEELVAAGPGGGGAPPFGGGGDGGQPAPGGAKPDENGGGTAVAENPDEQNDGESQANQEE